MHAFIVTVTLAQGRRLRLAGLFASGAEATLQMLADYPDARAVTAICLRKKGGVA